MLDIPFHKLDLIRRSMSFQDPAACQAFLDLEDEFFAMQRRLIKLQEEILTLRPHADLHQQANPAIASIPAPAGER